MKNRNGFTLVEILVSIGLLALLGSVIAISLNRVFKDNNEKHYNEYVEKIKSSAMLFVNNTVDIINDLNDNSFKIITIGDLIDNGYVNDTLVNPNTDEKVGKEEKIQVSYDSDHELIVTYPYNNTETEAYLYTLNYSVMYGDTTEDLCYVGLNTRSLQLINPDGTSVIDNNNSHEILVAGQNIKAYMENGEECTNLTSEKIGTYKIRYDYTKNYNEKLNQENVEKKSAERTITVKSSKPIINKFEVTKDKNAVYNPTITYNVSDSSKKADMELKYCINTTGKISDCNNWGEAKNSQDTLLKINLNDLDKNVSGKNKVDIYFFVKNGFEEYTYKSQNYKIKTEVIVKPNGGKYSNSTADFTKYVDSGTKLGNVITFTLFTRDEHKFEGLTSGGKSYTADTLITDDVELTAQWYKYCTNKTLESQICSKSCGGGNIIKKYHDSKYTNVSCGEETTSTTCNTDKCYTRCDETTTKKVCEKYCPSANDCWPIQYHYYKYDIKDNSLCDSWWSNESCSLSGESSTTDCPYGYKTYGPTIDYDNARWYCPDCNGYRFYCWNNNKSCQCRCGC